MSDPRSLFGERRLPEFLGGRRVDRYIPPEVRQGLGALLAGADMLNPVSAYREYLRDVREGDVVGGATNLAGFVAPGVAGALGSRLSRPAASAAAPYADDAARVLMETLSPFGAMDDLASRGYGESLPAEDLLDLARSGAVIRPDDRFRGVGTPRITVRETDQPFVVRGTEQSQIDDMIQSGLVRPNVGGYGAQKSSQLYFRESPVALPTDLRARPSATRFVLVGDSAKLAGTEGPIPIDQLRHVWAVRGGETVDILPEILRANREFGGASRADLLE